MTCRFWSEAEGACEMPDCDRNNPCTPKEEDMRETIEKARQLSDDLRTLLNGGPTSDGGYTLTLAADYLLRLAGARDRALEEAANVLEGYDEYDQRLCCDGHECGCHGASVHEAIRHFILALRSTPAPTRGEDVAAVVKQTLERVEAVPALAAKRGHFECAWCNGSAAHARFALAALTERGS